MATPSRLLIQITSPNSDLFKFDGVLSQPGAKHRFAVNVQTLFNAMVGGSLNAQVAVIRSGTGVRASGTLTGTTVIATNTVAIAGVTLTAHASTQDATNFVVGASDTETMANLVTTILANTTLNKIVTASSALTVTTVTCLETGVLGNQVTLASGQASIVASGSGKLAAGAGDLSTPLHYGY
jgi:X-X-X-Leu-X-X-Gly heptad repeat protein